MNKLSTEKRAQVLRCLVEGNSVRSTVRMTGVAKGTILKLIGDVGPACESYMDRTLKDLVCRRIQCDEIWSFVYSKEKNVPEALAGVFGFGDVWTWIAIDADSKLVVSWMLGERNADAAVEFMKDVAGRLSHRVQLTTDGLKCYLEAVYSAFGNDIDFAQLVKVYGTTEVAPGRYSPPQCTGATPHTIKGNPDPDHISTSYIERQNLTVRMGMRRFTRLTNAFSKKVENHRCSIALHYMYYNFARIHMSLGVTPAMAAGVDKHLWSMEEIAGLLD